MNGTVESIWIASRAGEPMVGVPAARAVPGVGLEGDRYAAGLGHDSGDQRVSRDLTLIEAEVLEGLEREHGVALGPQEARRNVRREAFASTISSAAGSSSATFSARERVSASRVSTSST